MKYIYTFFFCLILFLFNGQSSNGELRLSLSPSSTNIVIKPGKKADVSFTVKNLGDPLFLTLNLKSFIGDGYIGSIKLLPDLNNAVTFDMQNTDVYLDREFLLGRGESRQIDLTASVDETVNPNDYYYMLLARSSANSQVSGPVQLGVEAAIGTPIIISVSELAKPLTIGNLTDVTIMSGFQLPFSKTRIIDSYDHPGLRVIVKNSGKYHFSTSGSIAIKHLLSKTELITIPPQTVLGKSTKLVLSKQDYCGQHEKSKICSLPTTFIVNQADMGRTVITVKISLPEGIETRTVTYLALPIKLLTVILLSLSLGLYYLKRVRP